MRVIPYNVGMLPVKSPVLSGRINTKTTSDSISVDHISFQEHAMSEICIQPTMDFGIDDVAWEVTQVEFAVEQLREAIRTMQGRDQVDMLRLRLSWTEERLRKVRCIQG
jgi:hypothetical protein